VRRRPRGTAALLAIAAAILLGCLAGIGAFTFIYGKGTAYLSDNPRGCANCHVMEGQFDSWQKSSHRHVAVCNDCHLPPGFFGHWLTKADNGMFHSLAFTTGDFPDPIRIKPRNAGRTRTACMHCHGELVGSLAPGDDLDCLHCHDRVGHGPS
jgi:cytochrome c nitrite reductase small subunit